MENKKILIAVLIWAVSITWLTYASVEEHTHHFWKHNFTSKIELTEEQKSQMEDFKVIMDKTKNWEALTEEEQARVDELKWNMWGKMKMRWDFWEWKWMWVLLHKEIFLTDEDKEAFEAMSETERKEYFEDKAQEQRLKMESHENVIDKLLLWETLSSQEEVIRQELIQLRSERKGKVIEFKMK